MALTCSINICEWQEQRDPTGFLWQFLLLILRRNPILFVRPVLFVMHNGKPTGVALHNLFSDSAHPHYASDPPPQSFVGSSYHRTALNLDSETLSQVPYDAPAHLGLDQKKFYLLGPEFQPWLMLLFLAWLLRTSRSPSCACHCY